jgi:hypothetical protein
MSHLQRIVNQFKNFHFATRPWSYHVEQNYQTHWLFIWPVGGTGCSSRRVAEWAFKRETRKSPTRDCRLTRFPAVQQYETAVGPFHFTWGRMVGITGVRTILKEYTATLP